MHFVYLRAALNMCLIFVLLLLMFLFLSRMYLDLSVFENLGDGLYW